MGSMPWLLAITLAAASGEEMWLINILQNPSFEEGAEGRPSQWTQGGAAARADLAWDSACWRSGERSLRIGRASEAAWWEGPRIPVRPADTVRSGVLVKKEPGAGAARIALVWIREGREVGITPGPPAEAGKEKEEEGEETDTEWFPAVVAGSSPPGADGVRLRLVAEPGRGAVWFDDVFLGIDNPEIEVFGSHVGFHTVGLKEFVVRSRVALIDPYAILAGVPDGGERIRKGFEVHPIPVRMWGYFHCVVDLTDFLRPGTYAIEIYARFPDGYGKEGDRKATGRTFRISDRIYCDLARLASGWFAPERCGVAVPGDVTGFVEAAGGWHDGSDYSKLVDWNWPAVLALADLERLGAGWLEPKGRALEEAAWGVRFLVAMARSDGSFYTAVAGGGDPFVRPPEAETDNRPRTGDERPVLSSGAPVQAAVLAARVAWGLAAFAAAPGHADPDLRGRALRASRRSLAFAMRPPLPKGKDIDLWGAVLGAACALWRTSGDAEDQDIADDAIQLVLRLQHPEGWFRGAEGEETAAFDPQIGFPFVVALADYAAVFPDGSFAGPARDALERFFSFEDRLLQATPFGVPAEYSRAEERRAFPLIPGGPSAYYCATAYAALRAAEATRNPRFVFVAERILQWILGENPRDTCLLTGAGGREPATYLRPHPWIPGHEDGRIPGGVIGWIEGPASYSTVAQAWVVASFAEIERALRERARILDEVEEERRRRREGGR